MLQRNLMGQMQGPRKPIGVEERSMQHHSRMEIYFDSMLLSCLTLDAKIGLLGL